MTISGARERIGHIISCSNSITQIFGYDKETVIGTNCTIVVPEFIKERHDSYLIKNYESGRNKILDRTRKVLA